MDILSSAQITGPEFFALSYIKYRGKKIDGQRLALPVSELKAMLVKIGQYDTASGAAGFVTTRLEKECQFVRPFTLTHEEKRTLFPDSTGYRDAVVLTDAGLAKLEEVNRLVEELFAEVAKGIRSPLLAPLLFAFRKAAKNLTERLEKLSAAKRTTQIRNHR